MEFELNLRSILMGAVLLLGIALELIKCWPSAGPDLAAVEENILSSRPYAVSEKAIHAVTQMMTHTLPAMASVLVPSNFDFKDALAAFNKNQVKAKQSEALKKAAKKGWHWVWNKEENKWVWKKTKKKTEDKKDDAATTAIAQTTDDSTPPSPTPTAALPNIPLGPTTPTQPATAESAGGGATGLANNKFLSASEWEEYLESSPSNSKTQSFVQQYKNHLVTDQVFYQVTTALLKDSSATVQQQGVLALGLTPSVESFDQLASEQQTLQTSSPLLTSVNQDLSKYTQSPNLSILNQVLGQSSATTADLTVGLTELQTAVQNGGAGGTQGGTTTQGGASNFSSFVATLTTLKSNSNQTIASQANTILGEINVGGNTTGGTIAGN